MLNSLEGQAKVKRPCDRTRKRRRQQLLRQPNPVCFYCGHGFDPELLGLPLKQTERGWKKARRMARPTLEHLLAVSAGGTLARQNCELAHAICNIAAGSIPLADKLALAERKRAAFGQVAPEAWWKAQLEWEATARRSVVAA
jgi:5-methylcytosine-specific restriction endonuclease McrA